jgi:RNA polymerase sigma factor (sigma-70 family)
MPAWTGLDGIDTGAWRRATTRRHTLGPGLDAHGQVDTPETMAIRADEVRRVRGCLAQLSTEHREVIVLRDIEDMSYRDIGAVVGIPIGTVMSRLARGREQLGRLLGIDRGRRTS